MYIESWNSMAKKYINVCAICGTKGYNPEIEKEGFCSNLEKKVIKKELTKILNKLPLDNLGRCSDCARVQDISK